MRNILLVVGVAGLVSFFSACGSKDHAATIADGTTNGGKSSFGTGGKSSGGKSGSANAAGDNAGGANDMAGAGGAGSQLANNGPVVKITSPTESATPDDGVLSDQVAHVVCLVLESSAPTASAVDPATITVSMTDSSGKVDEKGATATKNANEYAIDFVLTTVPAGPVSFTCSAKDKMQLKQADTIATFIDHGPKITVTSPLENSAHPIKGGLAIDFTVDPVPLAKDDPGADVGPVTFALDGKPFDLKEVSPGVFHTDLALDDTNKFPQVPNGAVTITAANKRAPTAVTDTKSYNIIVDGSGPGITIESPAPQRVVGGKVTIQFTVTDVGSGVDPKSVNIATYPGADPQFYDPDKGWTNSGDKYTFTFDTKSIEAFAPVQTTINILASDKVGNQSATGQSLQLYLDNVPPQIDLDPANIRMKSGPSCSASFDPVGPKSVNDFQGTQGNGDLTRIGFFRAFVVERTNHQAGQQIHYYSGTNQSEVRLYVQPDPEHAQLKLLVNKNPEVDTTCDDIGGIDNVATAPPFSALKPISTNGPVGNILSQDDPLVPPTAASLGCTTQDSTPPPGLCPTHNSDILYVPFNGELHEPYLYVVGTPNPNDVSCAGIDLAFLAQDQPAGWVCVAARVVDNAGNVGVSPPLRICVDDPLASTHPDCATMSVTPPTCSDGCTPPARGGNVALTP